MAEQKRSRKKLVIVLGLVGTLMVGAGIAVGVLYSMIPGWVKDEARARGVELTLGEIDFGFSQVTLTNTGFRLVGVKGLQGKAERVTLKLVDWKPTEVDAEGIQLSVQGSAATLALELSEWTKQHPSAYRKQVVVSRVDLSWRAAPKEKPWLTLTGGALAPIESGTAFKADKVTLGGVDVGRVGAAWTAGESSVAFGFGSQDTAKAPVRLRVFHDNGGTNARAEVEISPVPLKQLAGPLAAPLPVPGSTRVSGKATFALRGEPNVGPVDGTLKLELLGYLPPQPAELRGVVFGDNTSFATTFNLDAKRELLKLSKTEVRVGNFKLLGDGEVRRLADHAQLKLKLQGNLACTDLADAAAKSALGAELGGFLGKLARQNVRGGVGITVVVDADSRKLAEARVAKLIGVGCGLKPLSLPDLTKFPELKGLPGIEELTKRFPGLPAPPKGLPSALPPLPAPPKGGGTFPFPPFGQPKEKKLEDDPQP